MEKDQVTPPLPDRIAAAIDLYGRAVGRECITCESSLEDDVMAARAALDAAIAEVVAERDAATKRADGLAAELAKLRGRDAEPFDFDALPTVEEWVAEHLPEKEPRAGSQMAEVRADEVVAHRGELRRVAGWLKDITAECVKARTDLAAAQAKLAEVEKERAYYKLVSEGWSEDDARGEVWTQPAQRDDDGTASGGGQP